MNSSFSTGVFPDQQKYAVVKPSLKAEKDRDEFSPYRPLYNTSFLSRVLETACLKQLNEHLSEMPALQNCNQRIGETTLPKQLLQKYIMNS